MQPFSYVRPETPEAAVQAFAAVRSGARYIAGGTTLYDLMKLGIERPAHLIDVTAIDGLDTIDSSDRELRFGALTSMSALADDPVLRHDYPVLHEALSRAASQQLRNMATIAGNLLQRTRCMYFRNGASSTSSVGAYPCNKREPGSGCAAISGHDRGQAVLGQSKACTAVSPGDWPVALTAMDASVELLGAAGRRTIPVSRLYRLPGTKPHLEFTIRPDELITCITVPKTRAGRASTYHKIRERESYAFALASAAVALDLDGDRVQNAHIALGGVATRPWRATEAEQALIGKRLTPALARAAGRLALKGARPGNANAYKIDLAIHTVADALIIALGRAA